LANFRGLVLGRKEYRSLEESKISDGLSVWSGWIERLVGISIENEWMD